MNCKPGDLAVIVKTLPAGAFLLGRMVEVVERADEYSWVVRLQNEIRNPFSGDVGREGIAADDCLRPLRDPGEDAQDETLSWLPVPERDEVTA